MVVTKCVVGTCGGVEGAVDGEAGRERSEWSEWSECTVSSESERGERSEDVASDMFDIDGATSLVERKERCALQKGYEWQVFYIQQVS